MKEIKNIKKGWRKKKKSTNLGVFSMKFFRNRSFFIHVCKTFVGYVSHKVGIMHNEGKASTERKEDEKRERVFVNGGGVWVLVGGRKEWIIERWKCSWRQRRRQKREFHSFVPRHKQFILKSVFIFRWLYRPWKQSTITTSANDVLQLSWEYVRPT